MNVQLSGNQHENRIIERLKAQVHARPGEYPILTSWLDRRDVSVTDKRILINLSRILGPMGGRIDVGHLAQLCNCTQKEAMKSLRSLRRQGIIMTGEPR